MCASVYFIECCTRSHVLFCSYSIFMRCLQVLNFYISRGRMKECSTYFSALHANNRRVLGLSTDIELDLSSVPQENILLFRPKTENNKNISSVLSLKRMEKTVEKNISSVLSLKRVETAVKKLDIEQILTKGALYEFCIF